jgi:hypothetical protein
MVSLWGYANLTEAMHAAREVDAVEARMISWLDAPKQGASALRHDKLEQEGRQIQRLERLHAGIMQCFRLHCRCYLHDVADLFMTQ